MVYGGIKTKYEHFNNKYTLVEIKIRFQKRHKPNTEPFPVQMIL